MGDEAGEEYQAKDEELHDIMEKMVLLKNTLTENELRLQDLENEAQECRALLEEANALVEEKDAQIMVLEERGVDLEKENCRIKKENEGTKEDYQCLKREYEQQAQCTTNMMAPTSQENAECLTLITPRHNIKKKLFSQTPAKEVFTPPDTLPDNTSPHAVVKWQLRSLRSTK